MKTIYDFSKSEILIYLKKKVKDKNIIILDQISFSKKEFTKNKNNILNIIEVENPEGVIIQFGGQTPLKLAVPLQEYFDNPSSCVQTKIWGTPPDSIDLAEDRERFEKILCDLQIKKPPGGIARSLNNL